MPNFTREGLDLWFEVLDGCDPGPPRMFINGSGSTVADVRPLLSAFRGGCPLAVLDHRGMGRSSTPDVPPSMADFAADVVALADHLAWSRFDLIGVSFGGMVAQELACRSPERVNRLVLVCTSAGGEGGSSYPLHDLMDLDADARRRVLPRLQDSRFDEEWLRTHDGPVERLMSVPNDRPNTVGYRMQMEARRQHDVWDRLPKVDRPTLVASGAFDRIAPPPNGARIAERLPDARHQVYDGGHMFFLQDRSFFADLERFLSVDTGGHTTERTDQP